MFMGDGMFMATNGFQAMTDTETEFERSRKFAFASSTSDSQM